MTTDRPVYNSEQIREWILKNVPLADYKGRKLLLIVPDATRTAPLPALFAALREVLVPVCESVDLLVALGTHPPMEMERIRSMPEP